MKFDRNIAFNKFNMSTTTSNITSGFIDIATFDEIEKYMYGGPTATAYFVREIRKSTWFTQVPVTLSRNTGNAGFGQEWSVSISRAGDYLLHSWLRVNIPQVTLTTNTPTLSLRWTKNLMHNLIREVTITFNDLVAARFDNFHLDFWTAFTTPASLQNGYQNMIGNISSLINPVGPGQTLGNVGGTILNLILPTFNTRDTGVALPTAALPYNEMQFNFNFRNFNELLVLMDSAVAPPASPYVPVDVTAHLGGVTPTLSQVQVWANYAIVSNEERRRMGCAVRDILIEQVQTAPRQNFTPLTNQMPTFDIRFSHAIKALFFSVRNKTGAAEWSNYATSSPVVSGSNVNYEPAGSFDPISSTSLIYENTNRLGNMGSDYFSLVAPYYHATSIPTSIGYHLYSYSLHFTDLDPMGSTNYGKLTNVSVVPQASPAAIAAAGGTGGNPGSNYPQSYEFVVSAVNNNIIRISGGALGFPVL